MRRVRRKIILALLACFAWASFASAQSSSVSIQVTDSGSVAWANGTVTFSYVGPANPTWSGGNLPLSITATLNSSGAATQSVPDTNTITPGPASWALRICPQVGISAQCINRSPVAITGATPTLTLTPPAIQIQASTNFPISAYADAELVNVSLGFTFFNTVNGGTPGLRVCSAVSGTNCTSWSTVGPSSGGGGAATISLTSFGAKFDGRECIGSGDTILVTNGSNVVSCNHGNFTSADVGKQFTASNGCCALQFQFEGIALFPFVPMHIATVTNATTITIAKDSDGTAANATSNCNDSTCIIAWATNDDTAITAAETAWQALPSCGTISAPAGITAILKAHFNTPSQECLNVTQQQDYNAAIHGAGIGTTIFGLFSGFDSTSCPSGNCFFSFQQSDVANLQFNGFGIGNTGFGASISLLNEELGSQWNQVACNGFGGSDGNLVGITFGLGARYWGFSNDGCGAVGGLVNGGIVKGYYSFFGDNKNQNLQVVGDITDFGSDYGFNSNTGFPIQIALTGVNSRYHGIGSTLFKCTQESGATGIWFSNAAVSATVILDGGRWTNACSTGNSYGIEMQLASQTVTLTGGTQVGGTTAAINNVAGGLVLMDPSTVLSGSISTITPSCVFTSGGGSSPSCALEAGSTNEKGTIIATTGTGSPGSSGTITLTFAGTYVGPTGAMPVCNVNPDDSGTAWGNGALDKQSTQSTTAPVIAWTNSASNVLAALATSSPYRISYNCTAR